MDNRERRPRGSVFCPRGMEYLTNVETLLVEQKVQLLQVISGFQMNNKYIIRNSQGHIIYYVDEETPVYTRCLWGTCRPFKMRILDISKNALINLYRHKRWECHNCLPCWLENLEVWSAFGQLIGTLKQKCHPFYPRLFAKNPAGDIVLKITGPLCTMACPNRDVNFPVTLSDGETQVGMITKQWSGWEREMFTNADYFEISFSIDLDVRWKTLILGACFLIDFMYYEEQDSHYSNDD